MPWPKTLDNQSTSEETAQEDKYLKFEDPRQGQPIEISVRILDESPVKVWRHWINNRAFNCPGQRTCPACAERNLAKSQGNPDWRNLHRFQSRYLVNVLAGPDVKIWAFGKTIGERLTFFANRPDFGDPRDYDISIVKTRKGPGKLDISYDVFPGEKGPLSPLQQDALERRHDLEQEIAPAPVEAIQQAIRGETDNQVTPLQLKMIQELAARRGFTLEHLGIDANSLTKDQAEKYLADLK